MADQRCPHCGGELFTGIARAWCIREYGKGGCGRYYRVKKGKLYRDRSTDVPWMRAHARIR